MKKLVTLTLGLMLAINAFAANPLKVGIVLSTGGLGDKSFNDSAYRGLEKAKKDLGIEFKYVEPASPAEDEEFLREYAEADYDLIIATGFQMTESAKAVAADYPNSKFAIIDDVIDLPNVKSLTFKEEEGSFLVGALAAMMSKTGTIGFVGGVENPLIKKFEIGYEDGAKYVNPAIKVLSVYTTGPNPFNDPVRGKENAISEINQGADVVYHAAGGTGMGVIDAAKEKGVYAIGVDSNQDGVAPGTVLTSMIKNVDVAVFDTVKAVKDGEFKTGVTIYGVAENGVGVTDLEFTKDKIGAEKITKLKEIADKIKNKEIIVKSK
ncbi:MAG: BMP family ABC transporter substrate-binding protein [Cetobacterium sp.]|uniref:BMP family lipoprotein n=1 Tax=unclassified Cetobacterium TaxID=2630983 RepID=UPI00163CB2EE|nr:BMP family ABC transporter substrate-binding protein [Cetobacterium sp. 2A]MBC2855956.1 BMP family ABC transporter substrate-binding protein [Cetobacterium sp. 2A]